MVRKHSIVRTKTTKYNTRHGIIFDKMLLVTEPKVIESTKSNEIVDKTVDNVDKPAEKKTNLKKNVNKPIEKKHCSKKAVDKLVDSVDKYVDLKHKNKKVVDKFVDNVNKYVNVENIVDIVNKYVKKIVDIVEKCARKKSITQG